MAPSAGHGLCLDRAGAWRQAGPAARPGTGPHEHADETFHTTTFALVPVAGVTHAVQLTAYQGASCREIAFVVPGSLTTTANRAGNASARRTFATSPRPGPARG